MRGLILAALLVLAVDQASKWWVLEALGLRQRLVIDVLPPYLRFVMGWNEGINFGLFAGGADLQRWILIGLALAICLWVIGFAWRDGQARVRWAAGALVGGALGNVIDRLRFGAVADFLNMSCCGIDNPFAFNIADIGVFIGAVALVLWARPQKTP